MKHSSGTLLGATTLVAMVFAGPAALTAQANPASPPASTVHTWYPGHYPWTAADVAFATGMIAHHSQAILIAGWAPSHGASPAIRTLCARIINAQHDEITLMQNWLRDRHQPVPDGKPTMPMNMSMAMDSSGMAMMPGMLSAEQLVALDSAQGLDFDRLFLRDMIQHHTGALTMVNKLFATPGAGQDEQMYKLASNIYADQSTEISRMQRMLLTSYIEASS